MRCYVCDYSEGEAKSTYYFSVVDPKGSRRRHVYVDPKTKKEICTYCAGAKDYED